MEGDVLTPEQFSIQGLQAQIMRLRETLEQARAISWIWERRAQGWAYSHGGTAYANPTEAEIREALNEIRKAEASMVQGDPAAKGFEAMVSASIDRLQPVLDKLARDGD